MPDKCGYILVTVADGYHPKQVAKDIIDRDIGDIGYIVRADVVTNSPGIVAPVVSVNNFQLTDIEQEILSVDGVTITVIWPVKHHVPKPKEGKKFPGDDPGTVGTNAWG